MNKLLQFCKCLFGFHKPPVYSGKIVITEINKETHKIEYGNVMICPACKTPIRTEFY